MQLIRTEFVQVKEQFSDARRTEICESHEDLTMEDLITEEDMVVTLSQEGYVKAQPVSVYQAQRRGGRGKTATTMKEEDFVEQLTVASSHDTMLCFSNFGKIYWTKVYQFPQAGRTARGKPMNNILNLEVEEKITAMLGVREFDERYVLMATKQGVVKKTPLEQFSRPRAGGIWAINLDEGDKLIGVALTDGNQSAMLFSDAGKAVRFKEKDVRSMGRTARGVRGIRLQEGQIVMSLVIIPETGCDILTVTEHGYGKRTCVSEYREVSRGAQGVMSIQTTERNGNVVRALAVTDQDEIILITNGGVLVRTRASEISRIGRNTQGVRLINLGSNEALIGVQRVDELQEIAGEGLEGEGGAAILASDISALDVAPPAPAEDSEPESE
jgi:DNA gyrase subunit A